MTLAALAREQESRLRVLLLDRSVGLPPTDEVDVTAMLDRHETRVDWELRIPVE